MSQQSSSKALKPQALKPPMNPHAVLAIAILLPGMGQVLNNAVKRGLLMVTFMVLLGYFTAQVADPNVSIIGRYAGGFFVYAISVMDAYYWAKYRLSLFKQSATHSAI
jgi:hypothetical protein